MNNLDKLLYVGNIINRVETLETQYRTLKSGTLKVTVLDHITNDIGLQLAGEFRSGNGLEPDYGFSGMRMGYPGFTYGSGTWALAGVNNDTLEFGVDYVTGKAWAGGGAVVLGSDGIKVYNGALLTGWWQTDGDLFLGSNLASPATTSFAYFTNAQAYNGEAIGAGNAMFGSNSAGLPNFFFDLSAGTISFRGGVTTQAYISNTGQIVAGGGAIYLDSIGLHITNGQAGLIFEGSTPSTSVTLYQDGTYLTLYSGYDGGLLVLRNDAYNSKQAITGYANNGSFKIAATRIWQEGAYLTQYGKNSGDHSSAVQFIGTIAGYGSDRGYFRIYSQKDTSDILRCYTSPTTTEWANAGIELMGAGPIINEFSIDGAMAGNSDTALPTEKAVVTYVAAHGGGGGGCPARAIMGV